MTTRNLLLPAIVLALFPAHSRAANVPLSGAAATFDQGAPYTIGSTLDGSLIDSGSGWGVFGGQHTDQTAFWTATSPVSSPDGLIITMPQFFDTEHHIQKFRLSLTTDAVPSLGGNWSQVSPGYAWATGGVTLSNAGANTFLATGVGKTTYRVGIAAPVTNVTGFRLELFTHDFDTGDALPASLGRAFNGNLVLGQFMVNTPSGYNFALGGSPTASAATWGGLPAENLVDGDVFSLSHPSGPGQNGFFYTVDLGGPVDLTSIELNNRADGCCPERLTRFRVEVLDALGASVWSGDIRTDGSNSGVNGIDTITEAMGAGTFEGRYIRVTNINSADYSPQISEIRAFGSAIPEPTTAMLAAFGGCCALLRRRAAAENRR